MNTLEAIIIGAVGSAIGSLLEKWLEKSIHSAWLCWILSIAITIIIIAIPMIVIRKLFF